MPTNFHTHSAYCDGKGALREYVDYAVAHGFSALGFSSHAPVDFDNNFALPAERYDDYCREVRALRDEYRGRIDLFLGLEIDYVPGLLDDFTPLIQQGQLDYFIGGVHLVTVPGDILPADRSERADHLWFIDGPRYETYDEGLQRLFGGDIRRAVTAFFRQSNEMIERTHPPIVAHIDKIVMHNRGRYFSPDDGWFQSLLGETLLLAHEKGCIVEVNTRGLYKGRHTDFYPSRRTLADMNRMGIPVIVSTDAHSPEDLTRTEGAHEMLREIGYRNVVERLG